MFKREHGTMNGNWQLKASSFFISATIISGAILSSMTASANDTAIDKINIRVPVACTLSGVGMDSHTASIAPGNYNSAIGETTVKAVCNDFEGFGIYAIGYTDSQDGKNVLTNSALSSSSDIITGTALSGNSQWAMKLTAITSPTPTYPITIQNSFDSFHTVPDDYTLVAKRTTQTDSGENAEGASFKTTYQAYISSTQPTGTYNGKVKYILVHPHTTPTPRDTMLDTGPTVCAKMKTLAAGISTACSVNAKTSDIKAIRMADSLPSGFTPSDANTVSTTTSTHPIYIFFDNTNDAGIMYFYTGGYQVVMNPNSSRLFGYNIALADISGLEYWDASNVTDMSGLLIDSTVSLASLNGLQRWDTSSVVNLLAIFMDDDDEYQPQLSDISAITNWDTSNVVNMRQSFQGQTSLYNIDALSLWNTSKVTNLRSTFARTRFKDTGALSNWDVSKVETMYYMFGSGENIQNDIDFSGLVNWNTSSVTDMEAMFQNRNISSFLPLSNWNVGSVKNFHNLFYQKSSGSSSSVTTLSGLENWNVGSAQNMSGMFQNLVSLVDASAINGWDVRSVIVGGDGTSASGTGFYAMFFNSPVHPTFTLRAGTWNSNGTFIPSS